MDPKLSNLDPKLQEAYNRVMSGPATPPSTGTVPSPQQPVSPAAPAIPAVPPVTPSSTPVVPTPAAPDPAAVQPQPQVSSFGGTIAFNANNAGKNQGTTVGVKKGGGAIKTLVVGLGIIIFLLGYTVVWIYIFKLNVPFLPQL